MGRVLIEELRDWGNGVITSANADVIPPNSSPRGWNSALSKVAADQAVVSKRRGLGLVTETAIEGNPAVIGQYQFRPRSSGSLGSVHLAVTDAGSVELIGSDGSVANLVTGLVGTEPPDFETANNLCFIANGVDRFKVVMDSGVPTVQGFGMEAPEAPTAVGTGSGAMSGEYEVALSYYNALTGHESSRSPVTVVNLSNEKLKVTIPEAADPQVTHVRVHIRKTTQNAYLFKVSSGTDYDPNGGGWPNAYGDLELDLSDGDLLNLLILSPDEDENDPPPDGIRYLCWHQSRMFAADDKTVYYSKVELPEAFDPEFFLQVNPDDGQLITGLHSSGGVLLIFKSQSVWGLFGDDPNSWYLRPIVTDIGCMSFRSILTVEDRLYWWAAQGPVQWDGQGQPHPIGQLFIQGTLDGLDTSQFGNVIAGVDTIRSRVIFAVASASSTRNDVWLPFNYRLNRWDASKWDPLDAASFCQFVDTNNQPGLMVGGYAGHIFSLWTSDNDGLPEGSTSTGTFTASGDSVTTVTDDGATFGDLVERKVTIVDANGVWVGRGRIAANDSTSFTLASPISGLTNGAVYTYYIGGPDFQWDTPWSHMGEPLRKKRYEYLWVGADAVASTTLHLDLGFGFNPSYGQTRGQALTGPSTEWADSVLWTARSYSTTEVVQPRIRIGRTGWPWRLRIRQHEPDKPISIRRIAVQAELQTTKR